MVSSVVGGFLDVVAGGKVGSGIMQLPATGSELVSSTALGAESRGTGNSGGEIPGAVSGASEWLLKLAAML